MPSHGIAPNFEDNEFVREFRHLFDHIGTHNSNNGNTINKEIFTQGCFLVPFDLSPDLCLSWHSHESKSGGINIDFTFAAPLVQSVTIIAFATFDASLEVDSHKRVEIVVE